jgi:crotonobetainyl-CoA:carnitine CoA-transferase CaiB-like acyl-CoA transferase
MLVVDLSALWAGPLCAHLLGLAGARVIKVESPERLDGLRRAPGAFYDLLHAGHESVVLDLRTEAGRADLGSLLRAADVVVESSRPRAIEQLGIEPEAVCAESPTTWISITAYGRSGPWSNRVGFGDDVAMSAGVVAYAEGDETPLPCGDALADPLAGLQAAVAALCSFVRGGSSLADVSMHRVAAATLAIGDPFARPAERGAGGWLVDTGACAVPAAAPTARAAVTCAAPPGRHTKLVLDELAVRRRASSG